jgi:toxin HigB-1
VTDGATPSWTWGASSPLPEEEARRSRSRRSPWGGNSWGQFGQINRTRERAESKLVVLNAAKSLEDLKVPPGNRLEALRGDREGQHSIRINRQYRVCFVWDSEAGDAFDVEITDYHD